MWSFCEIPENQFKNLAKIIHANKTEQKCNINKKFNPAAYADIEFPIVPLILSAATTEEINPVYETGAFGDIQPYEEVRV